MNVLLHPFRQSRAAQLLLILVTAFSLRLLPLLYHGGQASLFAKGAFDTWGYHQLASNLVAGHGYSWNAQPPHLPNLYRPPGLPVLLSGLYLLTGPSLAAAVVVQALVSTAIVLLTFLLLRRLHVPPGTDLTAAAVLALDPVAILYSNLVLTEVYTSFVLLLLLACLAAYWTSARPRWLLAGGALLAVGILLHPILLFVPVLWLAAPLATRATRGRRHLAFALAALGLAWFPASLWVVRNWRVGDYLGISCVTAVNLLKYKAASTEAELRGTNRETERDRLTRECEAELPANASHGDRYRLWQRRAAAILFAHPLTYAKVHLKGMIVEMFGPERDLTARFFYDSALLDEKGGFCTDELLTDVRANRPSLPQEGICCLILGWQGLMGLGLLMGTWQLARRRPRFLFVLLIVPFYVLLLSGGPEGAPRFRVLYLPILALLTALGFQVAWAWLSAPSARLLRWVRGKPRVQLVEQGNPSRSRNAQAPSGECRIRGVMASVKAVESRVDRKSCERSCP